MGLLHLPETPLSAAEVCRVKTSFDLFQMVALLRRGQTFMNGDDPVVLPQRCRHRFKDYEFGFFGYLAAATLYFRRRGKIS